MIREGSETIPKKPKAGRFLIRVWIQGWPAWPSKVPRLSRIRTSRVPREGPFRPARTQNLTAQKTRVIVGWVHFGPITKARDGYGTNGIRSYADPSGIRKGTNTVQGGAKGLFRIQVKSMKEPGGSKLVPGLRQQGSLRDPLGFQINLRRTQNGSYLVQEVQRGTNTVPTWAKFGPILKQDKSSNKPNKFQVGSKRDLMRIPEGSAIDPKFSQGIQY